jgi:hypothetical protein
VRYRIKTERSLPLPPKGWRPSTQLPTTRVLALHRPAGPFRPLQEVITPMDAAFTSLPVFDRSPAGWYRMGFYA